MKNLFLAVPSIALLFAFAANEVRADHNYNRGRSGGFGISLNLGSPYGRGQSYTTGRHYLSGQGYRQNYGHRHYDNRSTNFGLSIGSGFGNGYRGYAPRQRVRSYASPSFQYGRSYGGYGYGNCR